MQFLVAWPIAFVMTLLLWPASMAITGALLGDGRRSAPASAAEPEA